jgi:hypothetical protein
VASVNVSSAVKSISASKGFDLINAEDQDHHSKSAFLTDVVDSAYKGRIDFEQLKGVYEYKPSITALPPKHDMPFTYFKKTGESDKFVVKFPAAKAKPGKFYFDPRKDPVMANDFVFVASEYKYMWNRENDFAYNMKSDISIRDTAVSSIEIRNIVLPPLKIDFSTKYTLANGYGLEVTSLTGDTIFHKRKLTKNGEVVMEEAFTLVYDNVLKVKQNSYDLKVGIVAINFVRNTGVYTVLVDGVVQSNAVVEQFLRPLTNKDEFSILGRRNFQIKLEDGTIIKVAELLGDSNLNSLRAIFEGLRSAWFATNVVDYVAINIFLSK